MAETPNVVLPSGEKVPAIAYGTGTAWLKDADSPPDRSVVDAIKTALKAGYRHLDGAQVYNNETELGMALAETGLPRSELFVTTKAITLSDIEGSLERSLEKLGLKFVDLYLIHHPFSVDSPSQLQEAWRSMEQCQKRGLARNIGVSNFATSHIAAVLETAATKPCVNQIELHPYLQQQHLLNYMHENQILAFGYAPLTPLTKNSPGPADGVCEQLAEKYSVEKSAILLRWALDQGAGVVTTSGRQDRLERYLKEVASFQLDAGEVDEIYSKCAHRRFRGFFIKEFEPLEKAAEDG